MCTLIDLCTLILTLRLLSRVQLSRLFGHLLTGQLRYTISPFTIHHSPISIFRSERWLVRNSLLSPATWLRYLQCLKVDTDIEFLRYMENTHFRSSASTPPSPITTRAALLSRDIVEYGHYSNMAQAIGTEDEPIVIDQTPPNSPPRRVARNNY